MFFKKKIYSPDFDPKTLLSDKSLLKYVKKRGMKGDVLCCLHMGNAYSSVRSLENAGAWFLRGSDLGSGQCSLELAKLCMALREKEPDKLDPTEFSLQNALIYAKKAFDLKTPGSCPFYARVVFSDTAESDLFYDLAKSATLDDHDDWCCMMMLRGVFLKSEKCLIQKTQAESYSYWYSFSDGPEVKVFMAKMMMQGFVDGDPEDLVYQAAEVGHPEALYYKAQMIIKDHFEEAESLLRKSAHQGYSEAAVYLADYKIAYPEKGSKQDAISLYRYARDLGNVSAGVVLAIRGLSDPYIGLTKDQCQEQIDKAYELGNPLAKAWKKSQSQKSKG